MSVRLAPTARRARVMFASSIALLGCGVTGSPPDAAPGEDPAGLVLLVVTANGDFATAAGTPIAGAHVLVDRGRPTLERATTDDEGRVMFAAAGVRAYHVVYPSGAGWQVYTVAAVGPGETRLGGRPGVARRNTMTLTLPGANGGYHVSGPRVCALTETRFRTPTLAISYRAGCEGLAARVFAYADTAATRDAYLDANEIVLTSGSSTAITGAYVARSPISVEIANLPVRAVSVVAEVLVRSALGFTQFAPPTAVSPLAGAATVMMSAPPGAAQLHVRVASAAAPELQISSERFTPISGDAMVSFDAAMLPPGFEAIDVDDDGSLAWSGGGTGGTIVIVVALGGTTHWEALLEPAMTHVAFPALPADLAAARPAAFELVSIDKLEVPGTTSTELVRDLDRRWSAWPDDPTLVSVDGGARASILYRRARAAP